jgi:hypothetical protein
VYFKVLKQHLPGGTWVNHENLSRPLERDTNADVFEYEVELLPLRPDVRIVHVTVQG